MICCFSKHIEFQALGFMDHSADERDESILSLSNAPKIAQQAFFLEFINTGRYHFSNCVRAVWAYFKPKLSRSLFNVIPELADHFSFGHYNYW